MQAGRWSKQWEIRDPQQCVLCPTGTVCPIDGMKNPCSVTDFPTRFEPIPADLADTVKTRTQCMLLNGFDYSIDPRYQTYFWGTLDPSVKWAIDVFQRGPYFIEQNDTAVNASCYVNKQRYGSTLYQRLRDYYGPL